MKLGLLSEALLPADLPQALDRARELGLEAIELPCSGWQEDLRHCNPTALVADRELRQKWYAEFQERGLEISALSIHGQPLSPNAEVARAYERRFRDACRLAEAIGLDRLTLLAGLPEGAEGDRTPVWVTNGFLEQRDVLDWQWEERVIPYWTEHAKLASEHGCRLCFEMHPNDVVCNPASLLRLRGAVGPVVGANFDPSHLFWQGISPVAALRALDGPVFHVHAKWPDPLKSVRPV